MQTDAWSPSVQREVVDADRFSTEEETEKKILRNVLALVKNISYFRHRWCAFREVVNPFFFFFF